MNKRLFLRIFAFVLSGMLSYGTAFSQTSATNLKGQNQLIPGVEKYKLIVKFSSSSIIDIENGKPLFRTSGSQRSSESPLITNNIFQQIISYTPSERTTLRTGTPPPAQPGKFDHYAFRGLVYVADVEKLDKNTVLELAKEFEKLPTVEYAAIEPAEAITPPATPDFTSYQHYKYNQYTGQANVYGIDAEYAWSIGITGQGVKIADIEWGMDYLHEDLISPNFIEHVATTNHDYDDHGTSVAGIMYARNNGFGMTGMVHGADKFYGVSEITGGRISGITKGLQVIGAGDVFVYEMQTGGQNGEYVPADYNQAVWDITKTATTAGIIVVAAAGNGNQNLDDAFYASYRARGDNGSIRVGAGTKVGRNKASFSTYGSIVHLQGWGDWSVATTGYSDLYNGGPHANYNKSFSGTSSATPIVASAVVAVQSYSKTVRGITLTPVQMRDLLIQTGTAQGTGGNIGPLPNIRRAIEALQGNSNQLPTVSLTSPANGATFTAPATVSLAANAADADGTITKVEFYQGTTKLGEDATSPYTYSWTGIAAGTYSITAKAYDNAGAVTTSTAVSITVTNPSTGCTAPAWNSATIYTGDASLGAGKGEVVSYNNRQYRAQWWTQNNIPGTGTNNPWLDLGACATPNVAPTVSINAPANNATFTAPATISITANAADSDGSVAKVEFFNGATKLGEDVTSPYAYSWTGVAAGTYSITAKATDNSGAVTTSTAVSIKVNPANVAPTVSITAPANNATFTAPATIAITANAADSDGSVAKVEFFNGATKLGEDATSPYAYSWTGVAAGTYSITAKATDNSGAVTTSTAVSIKVNPANVAPTVSITAPANNATFTAPATVAITANATDSDGSVAKVEFFNGATKLGEDATSPYAYSWTGVAAGTYSITAKATDNSGAVTTSTAVSITVNPANVAPTVSITAPANNTTFTAPATVSITANAADSDGSVSKVEFFNGATKLGEDATSPYAYSWTGVAAGTYSITAKATDNSGAVTTSTIVSITVNAPANVAPTVSITAPANNATFTAPATVTITANAADSDGSVAKVEFFNGTTKLGEDATSPYAYSWTGVAAGTYSITAKATDNSGAATTSTAVSITINPAQTGTEDCSNIAPWNSASIYVNGDFVTYQNIKYKAKWWTTNNNPVTTSGQYDVWQKIGDCIAGTAPSVPAQFTVTPSDASTLTLNESLNLNVQSTNAGTIAEVSYILYKDTNRVELLKKSGNDFAANWSASEIGQYLLQVIVKNQNGLLIYSTAKQISVSKTTGINDGTLNKGLSAHPNPTTGIINFSENTTSVFIYDLTGKNLGTLELDSNKQASLANFASGIYLLQLQSDSGNHFIKIVKE